MKVTKSIAEELRELDTLKKYYEDRYNDLANKVKENGAKTYQWKTSPRKVKVVAVTRPTLDKKLMYKQHPEIIPILEAYTTYKTSLKITVE